MERSGMTVNGIIARLTLLGRAAPIGNNGLVGRMVSLTVITLRSIPAFVGRLTLIFTAGRGIMTK